MNPPQAIQVPEEKTNLIWGNDSVFHLFNMVYSWCAPYSLRAEHYHIGLSWLKYLSYTDDTRIIKHTYAHLLFLNTKINAISMEVILRGLTKAPVKKIMLHPACMDDAAVQLFSNYLANDFHIEYIGLGDYSDHTPSLYDQEISENKFLTLLSGLQQNKSITKFEMKLVNLSDTSWSFVADFLKNTNKIQEIKIYHCNLSHSLNSRQNINILSSNVKILKFSYCNLGDNASKLIASFVPAGAFVELLDLYYTDIQANGLKLLASALQSNLFKVKILSLNKCPQGVSMAGVEEFFKSLAHNTTLEELHLTNFPPYIIDLAAIAIRKNSTLRVLNLSNTSVRENLVYENRTAALAQALTVNKHLVTLNLYDAGLDPSDLFHLCNHMGQFSIKELNLGANRLYTPFINDQIFLTLARGIEENKSFLSLDLSRLGIFYSEGGLDGELITNFNELKQSLAKHPTLTSLNLGDNYIDGAGIADMLLSKDCKIKHLKYSFDERDGFNSLLFKLAKAPMDVKLHTLDIDIKRHSKEYRRNAEPLIASINDYRTTLNWGLFEYLLINKRGWKVSKNGWQNAEHPDAQREFDNVISLNKEIANKIVDFVGVNPELRLL